MCLLCSKWVMCRENEVEWSLMRCDSVATLRKQLFNLERSLVVRQGSGVEVIGFLNGGRSQRRDGGRRGEMWLWRGVVSARRGEREVR